MLKGEGIITQLLADVQQGVDAAIDSYNSGDLPDEDDLTPVLVHELKQHVSDYGDAYVGAQRYSATSGVKLETVTGADLAISFRVDQPDMSVNKIVLVQAKRKESSSYPDKKKLKIQCYKMMSFTPFSYVFVYSKEGIKALPALALHSSDSIPKDPLSEYFFVDVRRFFSYLFRCFIGAPWLWTPMGWQLPEPGEAVEANFVNHWIDFHVGEGALGDWTSTDWQR